MARSIRSPSKMSIPEEFIEEAMNEMQRRPAVCVFCGTSMTIKVLDEHYETCDLYPVPCPYKCGQKELPRNQMRRHLLDCPLSVLVCEFADVGCNFQGLGKAMEKHKQEKIVQHLDLLCESHFNYKTAADVALGKLAANLKEKAAANASAIRSLDKKMNDLNQQLHILIEETKAAKIALEKKKQDNLLELEATKNTVNKILTEGVKTFDSARGYKSINYILNDHIRRMSTTSVETMNSNDLTTTTTE